MTKRHEIYEQVKDLHVATVMVYPNASNVLFYDAALTEAVMEDELEDLFIKGMTVVVAEGEYAKPVAYSAVGVELSDGTTVYTATAAE